MSGPGPVQGTRPPGTTNEEQAAKWVRQMFGAVAARYDLLNHVLSFNIDKGWRKRLLQRVDDVLGDAGARVLDLCCGTGDVAIDLERATPGRVWGADFCHPMLIEARRKIAAKGLRTAFFEADALQLPVRDGSFDLITMAFGFRNLANYDAALGELLRVLRPGGRAALLEFSHPPNTLFRVSYNFYSKNLLPRAAALLSGSREAYTYLPDSIERFPAAGALAERMRRSGFENVSYELLTFGIAALHIGRKGK